MITLETERLLLRTWSADDADDLFEYAKDPDVGPNAGWKPHESREESAQVIDSFLKQDIWAIVLKENNKVIGSVGLHGDHRRKNENSRMIGYVLSKDYWGRGLMPETVRRVIRYAFELEKIELLSCYHYPFNMRSKRVIEKCGFHYEGTLRLASTIYNGSVYDSCCYSITRDDYHELKGENCDG